jgi:hypothetical protein
MGQQIVMGDNCEEKERSQRPVTPTLALAYSGKTLTHHHTIELRDGLLIKLEGMWLHQERWLVNLNSILTGSIRNATEGDGIPTNCSPYSFII